MNQRTPHMQTHPKRNALLALGGVLIVALGAWYYTHSNSASGKGSRSGKGRPSATVGVAKATLADMPVLIRAIGTAQPVTTATVRTQVAGTLFSLHFNEGQTVKKGQLLARIDPRPFNLALAQANANLAKDQAQLNAAKVDFNRYKTLLEQDSIARQQVDTQAALVKQLEGSLGADRAAVGTAKLNLSYTSIVAPVAGTIGLRQADLGNYLTPSDANGLAVITQTHPIDVSFSLPQNELPALQARHAKEAKIPVTAQDQSGTVKLAEGTFLTFDNVIDATSGTVKAKARFPNDDGKLFPNQFVNIQLLADTLSQAVTVPVTAVRHRASGDFVFVVNADDTVKLVLVKTGPTDTKNIVIASGLDAGVTVVTEGADGLDDGSKVTLASKAGKKAAGSRGKH